MQQIPLNTRTDLRQGKRWVEWCERVDAPKPVDCDPADSSIVRLQYSETFDAWGREFSIGYANNVRTAIERFGVFPVGMNLSIVARGAIDREGGGIVEVKSGDLRGAKLVIAKDLHPGEPESFDSKNYRAFRDPSDNLVSAWDSFEAYIGSQAVPAQHLRDHGEAVSTAVLVGPYRTIVNRPATITLPIAGKRKLAAREIARLRAFIYNEASLGWDPVFVPAGSAPLRYDAKTRTASFDTQVLGVFALVVTDEGWSPMKAMRHRYPVGIDAVNPNNRAGIAP